MSPMVFPQTTNLGVSGSNPFGRAIKSRISPKRRANRTVIARDPKRAGPSGQRRGRAGGCVHEGLSRGVSLSR